MSCLRTKTSRLRVGFTLIELLVVVAIIALLISILLPALNNARNQAKAAACLSNLKQVGMAAEYYVSDNPDYLPPFVISRPINDNYGDHRNTPYWFQYLPLLYLNNQHKVVRCPADDLIDINRGGTRGPYPNLVESEPDMYWSYSMNPNQPKRADPIYPNTREGKISIAPEVIPYNAYKIVQRFNPGLSGALHRPAEFGLLMETASAALLNPNSPFDFFRTDHGSGKDAMNIVFGDGHAARVHIRDVYPSEFLQDPPLVIADRSDWSPQIRMLWYGDEQLTYGLLID